MSTPENDYYIHPTDGREKKPWNPGPDNGKCAACVPVAAIIAVATAMAVGAAMNDEPDDKSQHAPIAHATK